MSLAIGTRAFTNRWLMLALGSIGWLGLALPARSQTSQLCLDEIHFYQQNRIIQRAEWGRTALRQGYVQPAVAHLVAGLETARASHSGPRAVVLENFIEANSGSTGWLIHEVDRLIELGEIDAVRTVLAAAYETVEAMSAGYSALKIKLLTTIAVDYGEIGEQDTALALLAQAQQLEPNVQGAEFKTNALIAIARGYGAVDAQTAAAEVATQALQQAEAVDYADTVRRDRTLAQIATVYAEAGQLDRALQLPIEAPYLRESIIGKAARSAARSGRMDQAESLMQQLTLEQLIIRTLTDIGLQLANDGDREQAQQYFDRVVAVISDHGYPGSRFTKIMVDAGLVETVVAALTAAPEGRTKVDGLMDVAKHYAEVEDTAAATDMLRRAMAATHEVEQDYAQRELWEEIFRRAVQLEAYDLALTTVETLVEQGQTFNAISEYTTIAVAAAQSGQIELALDLIERIEPSYMSNRRRVWGEAAVAHAVTGDFDAAFATAEQTQSPYAKDYAWTLARIGLQQQRAGLPEESEATINRAVQTAEELDYASEQLAALNVIALEQAKAGLTEPANELLERVLAMLQAQTLESVDEFTLQRVAQDWVDIEEYGTALRVMDAIATVQPDSSLWKTLLVDRLIDQENYAQALEIIESRDASSLQTEEMMRLVELYVQAGQNSLASQLLDRIYDAADAEAAHLLRAVELYDHMEQTDRVLPTLGRAFEAAQTIPGEESQVIYIREDLVVEDTQDRGSLYEEIALAYGRAGAFEQGVSVIQALQNREIREQAMERLDCYQDFL